MLRVHELDKEMSGEDRFHLETYRFICQRVIYAAL